MVIAEGLNTQEVWKEWLRLHIPSVQAVTEETELVRAMQEAVERQKLDGAEFDFLQEKVVALLSDKTNAEYLHSIGNLALLRLNENAALNNSTFDVKRNLIISMDKEGQFIPFCTKMVFLKYYTPSGENQLHFWGETDRVAYIQAINTVLGPYLDEPIRVGEEP